jgi:hypothetical protein
MLTLFTGMEHEQSELLVRGERIQFRAGLFSIPMTIEFLHLRKRVASLDSRGGHVCHISSVHGPL